jgi:putative transposase
MATDNAKIESFLVTSNASVSICWEFESLANVLSSVPAFLDAVYNKKRLHSSLGYLPSVEFEALIRSESESATVKL